MKESDKWLALCDPYCPFRRHFPSCVCCDIALEYRRCKCEEEKAEIFERFNTVDRVMCDLGIKCAYDMPSFWCNKGKDYAVIETKYHKGYMQALQDVEKEIRLRFGFAERDKTPQPYVDSLWPYNEKEKTK